MWAPSAGRNVVLILQYRVIFSRQKCTFLMILKFIGYSGQILYGKKLWPKF